MHSRRFQTLLLPHLGFAHACCAAPGGGALAILTVVCALGVLPATAAAQQPAPPTAAGAIQIEPMENGFVIAPDVKITDVSGSTRGLVGAYGGYLLDNTFLFGAGAYWLPDGPNGMDLWYGGAIVGWQIHARERLGFSLRTLVGGGEASTRFDGPIFIPGFDHGHVTPHTDGFGHVHFDEGFFTLEPQANVMVRVVRHVRIEAGAGYRAVAGSHNDSSLRGVTGALAVQFSTADR
jgi:hypothetical protein